MMVAKTFEIKSDVKKEVDFLFRVLQLMKDKRYTEATQLLISRHDELTRDPALTVYDQRSS